MVLSKLDGASCVTKSKDRCRSYLKQFELNKVLNTGNEDIMFDTKEASLFEEDWKFLTFKIPDYDFIERTALKYSYMVKISDFNIIKSELELKQAKHQS